MLGAMPQPFDILILGAGAAGLAAAVELSSRNQRTLILEARDYVGGRIRTLRDNRFPMPVELGAEFVHGRPNETFSILRSANLHAYDVSDTHWQKRNGKLQPDDAFWQELDRVFDKIDRHRGQDMSLAQFLSRHAFRRKVARLVESYVEGFDAADKRQVGIEWLKLANRAEDALGEGLFRVAGGYDQVVQWMRDRAIALGASIELNAPVSGVRWSKGKVEMTTTDGRIFAAGAAIVTLPLGVLQIEPGDPGNVRFDPPLESKQESLRLLRMGPVIKLFLDFDQRWWEKQASFEANFIHAPGETFPTWWTTLPFRTTMLTGWCAGPAAYPFAGQSPQQIFEAGLRSLIRITGIGAARCRKMLRAWHLADWQSDPLSRGAYSFGAVGGARAATQLGKPIDKTLFFAGEATHPGMSGTVSGAIATGQRAAKEVMKLR
jgi:monoamine oxidase